jgi:glycosyltransferase involved in cell wall biosynthesis
MNILMILADRDFPPDIRVEKEIRALTSATYQVTILCKSANARQSKDYGESSLIVRVPKQDGVIRKANTLYRVVTFIDKYWARHIDQIIRAQKIDLLHVHDLPMLGTALKVGKKNNLPVIADLHENYPAALRYYKKGASLGARLKQWLIFNPDRWQGYETRSTHNADHILVVVDEALERLANTGIRVSKITVIENYVDVDLLESFPIDDELINQYRNDFVIMYIGGFGGEHRGLDTAIKAMPGIKNKISKARLLLVGDGSIKPTLEQLVSDLSLEDNVTFVPWQPFQLVRSYIALGNVCIVPHKSNPHTEATSPHKLFQYMLMGKPVVVSSCKPLQRIVAGEKCGLVFEAGSPRHFAEAVCQLEDLAFRSRLGEAGQKAVYKKYNWKRTSDKLIKLYKSFDSTIFQSTAPEI